MDTRGSFPGGKEAGMWRWCAEVKNAWSFNPTPQYALMAWCSIQGQGQLYTFYLFIRMPLMQRVTILAATDQIVVFKPCVLWMITHFTSTHKHGYNTWNCCVQCFYVRTCDYNSKQVMVRNVSTVTQYVLIVRITTQRTVLLFVCNTKGLCITDSKRRFYIAPLKRILFSNYTWILWPVAAFDADLDIISQHRSVVSILLEVQSSVLDPQPDI
jgi:hypothetical protein